MTVLLVAVLLLAPALTFAQDEEPAEEEASDTDEPESSEPAEATEPPEPEDEAASEAEEETAKEEVAPIAEQSSKVEATVVEVEPPPEPDAEKEQKKDKKKKKNEKETLEIGGRVHVGFDAEHKHNEDNEWKDTFRVRRARVKLDWTPEEWVRARVQIDAAPEYYGLGLSIIKDAFIILKPIQQFGLRLGQFKRPFSGLELTSSGKLLVIERGIGNELIVDGEFGGWGYGDREMGVEIGGELLESLKLEYALGVFNGSGPSLNDVDKAKDVAARLSIRPVKQFAFGVSGAFKFFDESRDRYPSMGAAAASDIQLKFGGFKAHIEGIIAQYYLYAVDDDEIDPSQTDPDLAFNVLGILSYKFKIDSSVKLAVEPVVKVEYLDPNDRFIDDHAVLYTIGFNTYVGKYFRVMLDFEILRAERHWQVDDRPANLDPSIEWTDPKDHKEKLMLLLCFDI
jgi:hypothetical protein